jgi:hypothetical protein
LGDVVQDNDHGNDSSHGAQDDSQVSN